MRRNSERLLPAAYALLGLLADGASHGYDLHRPFAPGGQLANVYRLEINQLYALLKKLAELGLIEQAGAELVGSAPPRRYYSITQSGLEELDKWLRLPVSHPREIRLEFLVKLYFAFKRNPDDVRLLLDAQRVVTLRVLEGIQAQLSAASLEGEPFNRSVLELRLRQCAAVLDWLDDTLQKGYFELVQASIK